MRLRVALNLTCNCWVAATDIFITVSNFQLKMFYAFSLNVHPCDYKFQIILKVLLQNNPENI